MRRRAIGPVLVLVLGLAGCGGSAPPASAATASSAGAASPKEPTREERCVGAARECARAGLTADESVLDCMPESVIVKYFGSRKAALAAVKKITAAMAEKGITIESTEFDLPHDEAEGGGKLFAIVPQRVTMSTPGGRVRTHSYLLAVSTDGGTTWKFVDGARLDTFKVKDMFPDFPPSIGLPRATVEHLH